MEQLYRLNMLIQACIFHTAKNMLKKIQIRWNLYWLKSLPHLKCVSVYVQDINKEQKVILYYIMTKYCYSIKSIKHIYSSIKIHIRKPNWVYLHQFIAHEVHLEEMILVLYLNNITLGVQKTILVLQWSDTRLILPRTLVTNIFIQVIS